jgi:hypothetical protein
MLSEIHGSEILTNLVEENDALLQIDRQPLVLVLLQVDQSRVHLLPGTAGRRPQFVRAVNEASIQSLRRLWVIRHGSFSSEFISGVKASCRLPRCSC